MSKPLELTNNELTAVYAALCYAEVSTIYKAQSDELKLAAGAALDKVSDEMTMRGLLV